MVLIRYPVYKVLNLVLEIYNFFITMMSNLLFLLLSKFVYSKPNKHKLFYHKNRGPHANDPQTVIDAREEEKKIISQWINDAQNKWFTVSSYQSVNDVLN